MQLRGQIGVYGRAIGGIAAAHLVKKFPDRMKAFIGDRTLGSVEKVCQYKFKGGIILKHLQKLILCGAYCEGGSIEFIENRKCYKIHAADPDDDIVDMWAAHHMDVARTYSRINYNNQNWKKLYKSL